MLLSYKDKASFTSGVYTFDGESPVEVPEELGNRLLKTFPTLFINVTPSAKPNVQEVVSAPGITEVKDEVKIEQKTSKATKK